MQSSAVRKVVFPSAMKEALVALSESGFTGRCEDSLKRLFFFLVNCSRVYFMVCPRQSLVSESYNSLLDITVDSLEIYLHFVSSWGFGLRPPLVLSSFPWFRK